VTASPLVRIPLFNVGQSAIFARGMFGRTDSAYVDERIGQIFF